MHPLHRPEDEHLSGGAVAEDDHECWCRCCCGDPNGTCSNGFQVRARQLRRWWDKRLVAARDLPSYPRDPYVGTRW